MTEVTAYRVGTLVFPTIQEAQSNELAALFNKKDSPDAEHLALVCAQSVVEHMDEVVAILTCVPKSKPKATRKPRSDKGTHRQSKDTATPVIV
jgi:hypothetical protein